MSDIEKHQRPRWLRKLDSDFRSVGEGFEIIARLGASPMEDLFLTALHLALKQHATVTQDGNCALYVGAVNTLRVETQVPIGRYAADVVLTLEVLGEPVSRLAIEVDGEEFHAVDADQVAHDKRRDRFFQLQGLPVFRFTGSEVFRRGPECVAEALQMLNDSAGRQAQIAQRILWLRERVNHLAKLSALTKRGDE